MTESATTAVDDNADVPEYPTPRDGKCPFAPPPELLATEKSVSRARTWDGNTPWLITGHAAQRTILSDPRVSANDHLPGFPFPTQHQAETTAGRPKTIFDLDGAEHARLRRMLTSSFSRKRMQALRPGIQQVTDDLIDKMLAGPAPVDLVEALSLPLPSLMICDLLGVPYTDHGFFQKHAVVATARNVTAEVSAQSFVELSGYLGTLITAKIDAPAEDVLSDLGAQVSAGELTISEAATMGLIMLIAGHETSANMITLSTALLLQNPDQLTLLRETEDPKVISAAVEELLRYLSIAHLGQRRIALEDIEIDGETIRAGDGIIAPLPAANWDPMAFPEPEKLDLTREARHHHTFGWGPHQCIGQQLARIELEVVFSTLYRRIPTMRLAVGFDELEFKGDSLAYGIHELPISW